MTTPPELRPSLLELIERCILAFERDGEPALEATLAVGGADAAEARANVTALRELGLLQAPEMPAAIGSWRVRQRLGSGGMGTVYLAEQSEPIARRAAIKVIRRGMDSHEVLARFAIERQTLALLDHPGIARILDAGSTDDGRPFLVMDYVPGLPIQRYCDERHLDTRQRIELFTDVCGAVQHAHHKGIVHRDLKPSNILVADRGGKATPVVIDFGVAKSVGSRLSAGTLLTLPGRLLGTPEYMSPEQATNDADVDTRTDVYSLGVVLYELLAGALPVDAAALRAGDLALALRAAEPPTPSTRLTQLGDRAAAVAAARRVSVGALRRQLRGDLDWIVMKALDRDRNRRYGMPAELAADLGRFLRQEPVEAGAPSPWYRLRKYWARHRLQVTAAAGVVVALTAGLVVSVVFHRRAEASAVVATDNLEAALQAVGELVHVGDSDLVDVPHLESVRRDLLQRAVTFYQRFLDRGGESTPRLVHASVDALLRLGILRNQLGEPDAAIAPLREVERLLAQPGAAAIEPRTRRAIEADALLERARSRDRLGDPAAALPLVEAAVPIARELHAGAEQDAGTQDRLVRALTFAAELLEEREPPRAMSLYDEAVDLAQAGVQRRPADAAALARLIQTGARRANLLRATGDTAQCLAAVASLRSAYRERGQRSSWALSGAMLQVLELLGRFERPDDVLELAAELRPELEQIAAEHPGVLTYRRVVVRLWNAIGNAELLRRGYDAASAAYRRSLQEGEAALALAPQDAQMVRAVIVACTNVAVVQQEQRRTRGEWQADEVGKAMDRAMALLDQMPAGEAQRQARAQRMEVLQHRGLLSEARGDLPRAMADVEAAIAIAEELVAESPLALGHCTRLTEFQRRYASMLLDAGRAAAALPVVDAAVAMSARIAAATDAKVRWRDRHRELLLLLVRARGETGDLDGAFAALAENLALGTDRDWVGRREAIRALAQLLARLPEGSPSRPKVLARGRELLADALAYEAVMRAEGTGHGTTAIMRGITLAFAVQLEQAAGEPAAAAQRAGEVVDAFAEALQESPSARGAGRVRDAGGVWLRALVQVGDRDGAVAAGARLQSLLQGNGDALVQLAAVAVELSTAAQDPGQAQVLRGCAIGMLQAARTAGASAEVFADARFEPLRGEPAFAALSAPGPAADKR